MLGLAPTQPTSQPIALPTAQPVQPTLQHLVAPVAPGSMAPAPAAAAGHPPAGLAQAPHGAYMGGIVLMPVMQMAPHLHPEAAAAVQSYEQDRQRRAAARRVQLVQEYAGGCTAARSMHMLRCRCIFWMQLGRAAGGWASWSCWPAGLRLLPVMDHGQRCLLCVLPCSFAQPPDMR